jgi:hypothetical protein
VQHQNDSGPFPRHKMIFSRCDICEKAYEAPETEIYSPTSAVPEEELEQREPLLVICDSCRQELELYPFRR